MRIAWNVRVAGWPPVRRVAAGMAVDHDRRQLGRRLDRAVGDDRPGDAGGEALVAVAPDDAGQLVLAVAVDHVGRRPRRRGVHPHVERSVVAEREAARGTIELRRGHAEVEQRAAEPVVQGGVDVVELALGGAGDLVGGHEIDGGRRTGRGRRGSVRRSAARRVVAAARAAGSRSMPRTSRSSRLSRRASVWPPPPSVASRMTPAGTVRNSSTISSSITGRCTKASVIAVPPSQVRRGSSLLLPSGRRTWWWGASGAVTPASGDLAASGGGDAARRARRTTPRRGRSCRTRSTRELGLRRA